MEVRIGVRNVAREISFESDQEADTITSLVEAALRDGTVLSLVDDKGRTYLVPADAIGFIHLGDAEKGRVGFGFA